jgi:arginase family enzyme
MWIPWTVIWFHGTGPVPGFDQHEVIAIINQIIKSRKVICFEVVEVNPLLDTKGNKMGNRFWGIRTNYIHCYFAIE